MRQSGDQVQLSEEQKLFLGVVEQISRPLVTISRMSELALTSECTTTDQWQIVQSIINASLQLVESYSLNLRVRGKLTPLNLEPITVSALLYDTAERLNPFAKQYGVEIELEPGPRAQPVITDKVVLQSALESLGQVFVMAQAEVERHAYVRLGAHRSAHGVVAGYYTASSTLGVDSLRRAHAMQGTARQPFQQLVNGPAAGVFVAESLLQTLSVHLHVAKYHNMTGLATTLLPSQQLQLV